MVHPSQFRARCVENERADSPRKYRGNRKRQGGPSGGAVLQPLAEAAIVFHPTGLAAVTAQLEAAARKFDEGPAAGADHDPQIAWKDGLAETEDD